MTATTQTLDGSELRRFVRFLIVGSLGTLLDFGLLSLLKLLGLTTLLANSLSFSAGVANNFTFNRLWTFGDQDHEDWKRQFAQFLLVSLVGLVLNNGIVLVLEAPLGVLIGRPRFGYLPAKAVATGLVVFWNYFANRCWTFRTSIQ